MGERAKKIVFFVVVGLLSPILASISEFMVLSTDFPYETPGMYVADLLFSDHNLATWNRDFLIWLTVDSPLWFLFLWLAIPRLIRAAERFREKHSRH